MALMQVSFFAETLGMCTAVNVILPETRQGIGVDAAATVKDKYPVLYLLHGASDDHTIWLRRTNIERYVAGLGLAVVMPEVMLSSYENMVHGQRWHDYIVEELPRVMETFFPISGKRDDKSIAGLSMGGMGALKIGLTHPDKYAAVGIFSSGNLFYRQPGTRPLRTRASGQPPLTEAIYGTTDVDSLKGTEWDPFFTAEKLLKNKVAMPRFFHVCGTEDFLLYSARVTRDWFREHPEIPYEYKEAPGAHTWAFWDTWVQEFLKFISL